MAYGASEAAKSLEKSRLLKCRFCSYTALYHSLLMRHERIHTGDRPYECAICSKRFVQKTHLENHMRMHSGERPFRCEHCPKSFVTSSGLVGHALSHSGSQALFKCDLCTMVFVDRAAIWNHVRLAHGKASS
ncbi:zinc finger protein 2-like [Ixodes scapularis]